MDITLQILNPEESDFLNACINNERWAQKKLYEDNYASMMSLSMRYANNNDDALAIAAWIRKIVINTAIDFYRRDLKRKSEDLNEANYITTGIPDAISTISSEEILKALQQLPHSYRSVFNLHVIEGYSHKEIAEMLNINESTCRSNLVKARTKLKNILLAADSDLR